MGDTDENLEERIQSAEEEIRGVEQRVRGVEQRVRGVEQQIHGVEEEIRSLEQKIRRVEEQIETCSDLQEKALLRSKEAVLWSEKALLRSKEDRLRDEKARLQDEKARLQDEKARLQGKEAQLRELILQSGDRCTEYEWLRQDLPSWDLGSRVKTPSASQKERMYTPVRVEHWDVVKDIGDYLNEADRSKRIHRKVDDTTIIRGEKNWKDIAVALVCSTCDYLSKKRSGFSLIYSPEANLELPPESSAEGEKSTNPGGSKAGDRDVQKCLFYARPPRVDYVVRCNGKVAAAFELKNGGLECSVPMHILWARCSCRTEIDPNCWCNSESSEGHARSVLNCILQLYEYMVLAKVGYGVLTDSQNWYLFKRDHGGCLYISMGFKWNGRDRNRQPPLPAAIAYLVNCAVGSSGEFDVSPRTGERSWSWEVKPLSSSSGGSGDDQVKDRTYKPNEGKIGGYRTSPARTRRASSNTRHNELPEIPASDLHLDDRAISSGGWSGYVVGGILNGRRVAVKLAPRDSERAEALLNEVSAYEKLRKYWGEFVPSLVGYGTTVNGQIMFIATEFIDGSPLGSGTVTEEVAIAARQALGAVHACKLLHGDVEARNIMVVQGTQPSVRLIDFGFARRSSNWRSQLAELKKLDSVLEDTMGVWVGGGSGSRFPAHRTRLCAV